MKKSLKGLIYTGAFLMCLNFNSVANAQETIKDLSANAGNLELSINHHDASYNQTQKKAENIVRHLRYIGSGLSHGERDRGNGFTYEDWIGECVAYVPVGKGVKFFIHLNHSDHLSIGITKMYPKMYPAGAWLDCIEMSADIFFRDQNGNNYGKVDYVWKTVDTSAGTSAYSWRVKHFDDSKTKQINDLWEKTINLFYEIEIDLRSSDYLENIRAVEKLAEEYKKLGKEFKKIIEEDKKKDK